MHTDQNKRYDKRNIDSSLRKGEITPKDYEAYLSRLPDVGDKAFDLEERVAPAEEGPGTRGGRAAASKKGATPARRG